MVRVSGWGKVLALNVYTHSMERAAPMGWRQTPFKPVLTESQHRPWDYTAQTLSETVFVWLQSQKKDICLSIDESNQWFSRCC